MSATASSLFSPGISLLLQSIGMFLGTLLCGTIPLYLPLSKTKLRVLEVIGAGLLVGASMTVVLPEGVSAIFQAEIPPQAGHHHIRAISQDTDWAWSALNKRAPTHEHDHEGHDHATSPESLLGSALLGGFLLMFL
jgi:zinc transporter 9